MAKLALPAAGTQLTYSNFALPVDTAIDATSDEASAAQSRADAAYALAEAKYAQPAGGSPLSFLSQAARDSIVQTDGTLKNAVVLTQAAYDALATKVSTTLYIVSG